MLDSLRIDWIVRPGEPEKFRDLWDDGMDIVNIAKELDRKPLEVALMILEQANNGLIKVRKNGIWGGENDA